MGRQWVNDGTGEVRTGGNPASLSGGPRPSPGIYNNGAYESQWREVYVPDVQTDAAFNARTARTAALLSQDPRAAFALLGLVAAAVLVIAMIFVVIPFVRQNFGPSNRAYVPEATVTNGISYYTADQIQRIKWLPWSKSVSLQGKENVVAGDIHDVQIDAFGNVTFAGNLKNVTVHANFGSIHAKSVEDSTLVARKITVSGEHRNTKERLLGGRP